MKTGPLRTIRRLRQASCPMFPICLRLDSMQSCLPPSTAMSDSFARRVGCGHGQGKHGKQEEEGAEFHGEKVFERGKKIVSF